MNSDEKSQLDQKTKISEIFQFLTRYCTVQTPKKSPGQMLSKRKSSGIEPEEPEKLEALLSKLKDEEYVKENLRPEDDSLTVEQEDFILYLAQPMVENKENQRLMRSFAIEELALYFIKYRTEESFTSIKEHVDLMK